MTLAAGGKVDAADVPKVRFIKKAITESVTNTIVLQNDDDFVINLEAGKTYLVELNVIATGPAAADVRVAWAITGGVTSLSNRQVTGPQVGTTDATNGAVRSSGAHGLTTQLIYGTDGTNGSRINEVFLVETTTLAAAGTLTCQWAQGTANVVASTFNGASFVTVTELGPA